MQQLAHAQCTPQTAGSLTAACCTRLLSLAVRRFGVTSSVRLNPLAGAKDYSAGDSFKLSFSFSGERLLVPWITVTDGRAHRLQSINFYFKTGQGFVLNVRWHATCQNQQAHTVRRVANSAVATNDERAHSALCVICVALFFVLLLLLFAVLSDYPDASAAADGAAHLIYHFDEELAVDPAAGLSLLVVVSAVATWIFAVLVLLGWDRTESAAAAGGGMRAGPGGYSTRGGSHDS